VSREPRGRSLSAPTSGGFEGPMAGSIETAAWDKIHLEPSPSVRVCSSERSGGSHYAAALGFLLAHELVRLDKGPAAEPALVRGGLAIWQQKLVAQYVEKHLSENIPIAKLAEIARLSRYHFCHSFRRTFGIPPHRYHLIRKVERAKALLRDQRASIMRIALDLGYGEASAFSTVFRKLVGVTPINYRRSLTHCRL
jgi:AraC family transcriptional regulator